MQGDWGEMVLKQILDMSGLQEGVNYETQMTREADGRFATALRKKSRLRRKKTAANEFLVGAAKVLQFGY